MLKWLFMGCIVMIAFGGEIDQRFVLDGDFNREKAKIKLYEAKILFLKNDVLKALQTSYGLTISLKKTENYYLIVVDPIYSKTLKEKLAIYGLPHYKKALFINADKRKNLAVKTQPRSIQQYENTSLLQKVEKRIGIGIAWMAIWLLSFLGLLLSFYRRGVMKQLQDKEGKLQEKEEKIKNIIQSLEV